MTPSAADAAAALDAVERVKARTRFFRSGHWFASVVFGVVILGAMPFYVRSTPIRTRSALTGHCRRLGRHLGFICSGTVRVGGTPLGRAFVPQASFSSLSSWATLYWTIAIVVGFAAVAFYYHRRARRAGVSGHLWPSIAVGLALLGLVLWVNYDSKTAPGDLWTRGTSAVIAIALGIAVLAILERSVPFGIFAAGFLGLAFLSSLYTVINLFQRLGIGGPFDGGNDALPNLLLPGAYLLVGGLCFLAGRRWSVRMHVRVSRLVT